MFIKFIYGTLYVSFLKNEEGCPNGKQNWRNLHLIFDCNQQVCSNASFHWYGVFYFKECLSPGQWLTSNILKLRQQKIYKQCLEIADRLDISKSPIFDNLKNVCLSIRCQDPIYSLTIMPSLMFLHGPGSNNLALFRIFYCFIYLTLCLKTAKFHYLCNVG